MIPPRNLSILARIRASFRSRGFPAPRPLLAAAPSKLRSAGVSRPKLRSLRDLATRVLRGEIPTAAGLKSMSDREIVDRLTAVRGIGVWTVQMLLMFRLGRLDVVPSTDYGIRKGFTRVFRTREIPSPLKVERRAERWRPYRSVASWYLWRALEV